MPEVVPAFLLVTPSTPRIATNQEAALSPQLRRVPAWYDPCLSHSPVKNAPRQRPALAKSGASNRNGIPSCSHTETTTWRIPPKSTPEGAVQTAPSSSTTNKFEVNPEHSGRSRSGSGAVLVGRPFGRRFLVRQCRKLPAFLGASSI